MLLPESPWRDIEGRGGITDVILANMLKVYKAKSKQWRVDGEKRVRGYYRADLADSWDRYLTDEPSEEDA